MLRRLPSILALGFILLCLGSYPPTWDRLVGVERLTANSLHAAYIHSGRLWVNGVTTPFPQRTTTLTRVNIPYKDRHPRHHYAASFQRNSFGWDYYLGLPLWIPAALVAAPLAYRRLKRRRGVGFAVERSPASAHEHSSPAAQQTSPPASSF